MNINIYDLFYMGFVPVNILIRIAHIKLEMLIYLAFMMWYLF